MGVIKGDIRSLDNGSHATSKACPLEQELCGLYGRLGYYFGEGFSVQGLGFRV